jgi:hypothetical protein
VSYKRTLIFLILLAALAGFYYVYEIRGGETRREAERTEKLLFSFKPDEATRLALKRKSGTIVAAREGEGWRIEEPVSAPADGGKITEALNALADLEYDRDLGEQGDLESFGLSEPAVTAEIGGDRGRLAALSLGATTPEGSKLYAMLPEQPSIYTVPSSAKSTIDLSLFDLRDKTVLDFSIPDVSRVSVAREGQTLTVEKRPEDGWVMTAPERHSADIGRVTGALDSIRLARVKKFVEEEAVNLKPYGLDPPSVRVELVVGGMARSLSFGKRTGSSEKAPVFALRDATSQVVELDGEMLEKLSTDVDAWRDRRLVAFDIDEATRLEIQSAAGKVAVERSESNPAEWRLTEPDSDKADDGEVHSVLYELRGAKVASFVKGSELKAAESALEGATTEVRLWAKAGETPFVLEFARPDGTATLYVRRTPEGDIVTADERLIAGVTIGVDQLRDRSVLHFEADLIDGIEVAEGKHTFLFRRDGVSWDVPGNLEMESYEVDRLLWDLRKLKYASLYAGSKDDAACGFDAPAMVVTLKDTGAPIEVRLVVGNSIPQGNGYYVLGSDPDRVMEVEDTVITEWLGRFGKNSD